MQTCPKCQTAVPEEMRFCLECGTALALAPLPVAPSEPPVAPPPSAERAFPQSLQPAKPSSTVGLKIAATPVMAPRPSQGSEDVEVDDETLKKAFERPVAQPGAVVCRFCKGPLDLDGDFCEQCGAPVSEAAPPGTLKPKPKPLAPPVGPPPAPRAPASAPARAVPPARAPVPPPKPATPPPPKPIARPEPPPQKVAPAPPALAHPPHTPPAEEQSPGLVGRLKGIFKKS
jgi:hypothetical protein